jgi:hypothetical protein
MRAYQKVGLIGGIITLIFSVLFSFITTYIAADRIMGSMIRHYLPMSTHYTSSIIGTTMVFFMGIAIIGVIAGVLGIIGAGIGNRIAGGVLLIIGAVMSLAVAFGVFGIGFILMLVGGILGLASTQRAEERSRATTPTQPQAPTAT